MAKRKKATKNRKSSGGKKKAAARPKKVAEATAPPETGEDLLGMDEAIAMLKTTRPTFYRWLRSGKIKGMKAGRQWRFERSEIERFLKGEEPQLELPVSIQPLVESLVGRAAKLGVEGISAPAAAGVGSAVDLIINLAVAMRASDVHIEPFSTTPGGETVGMIRYRVDGALHPL
ncbi:MAG: helix-turn-helix domain-containing protein, partial [Planctomycetota bacterium]